MVGLAEQVEPEGGDLRQHAALVGDARRQDPVERADPVGADQQKLIAQVVDVADLAAADVESGKRGLDNDGRTHARVLCWLVILVVGTGLFPVREYSSRWGQWLAVARDPPTLNGLENRVTMTRSSSPALSRELPRWA